MERICAYRNCNNSLQNKRKQAKYCCTSCKKMEQTYRKRYEAFIEKCIEKNKNLVDNIKLMKELLKKDIQN